MKTLKLSIIFSLLVCIFLAACAKDSDDSPLFDGNIIYAPPGIEDERPSHVHAPGTSAPDGEDTDENTDDTTEASTEAPEDTTAPSPDTDESSEDTTVTEDTTDAEGTTDTEDTTDTEPVEDTTESEETLPPIEFDGKHEIIDLRETLAVGFPVSGRFISAENPRLSLAVNYECTMSPDGEVTVTLDVGLLAHAIHCGGRPSKMGNLTIDGTTYNFATEAISNDSTSQVYVPFVTRTYTVEAYKASTTIDVSWMFNGSYGSDRIDALTASARLVW